MFNASAVFKKRLGDHIKLMNRYLRYIFNGHFMIALMFMIVTLAVYYQRWLEGLSLSFPAWLLISLGLSFVVLYNPVQSFLKEADKVFIAVREEDMAPYFTQAIFYNYIVQLYMVIFMIAVLSPLYFTFYPDRNWLLNGLIVLVVLMTKAWNLLLSWWSIQSNDRRFVVWEMVVRIILTGLLFYSIITFQYFMIIAPIYVIYLNMLYFLYKKKTSINWERMIQNDEARLAKFYRFVSLFAEVPHVKSRIRKRKMLSKWIHRRISFKKSSSYPFLFHLSFIRSGDYFSLFLRLTVLAYLIIIFLPNIWLKLVLALLFIYMTSFQLQSLFYYYRTNVWIELYPIDPKEKVVAFLDLSKKLTLIQSFLLSLCFLFIGEWIFFFIMFLSGSIFNLAFHTFYLKKRLQKVW